jgi:hypothetical protein
MDVFCTWEAAPLVRNRLVASGLICNHCGSYYSENLAPLPDAGMFVDHVEGNGKPGDEDDGFSMKIALEYGEAHVRDKGRGNTFLDIFLIFGFRRPGILPASGRWSHSLPTFYGVAQERGGGMGGWVGGGRGQGGGAELALLWNKK